MDPDMVWFKRARTFAAIGLLVWAASRAHLPPLAEDRRLLALPVGEGDPIDHLDRRFQSVSSWLPATGIVGYLTPASGETFGGFYVAEYALAPRLIVPGTDAEFVVVPPEAVADNEPAVIGSVSRDSRLQGYLLYRAFDNGMRVFRRVR
jgi:hypothetical protein